MDEVKRKILIEHLKDKYGISEWENRRPIFLVSNPDIGKCPMTPEDIAQVATGLIAGYAPEITPTHSERIGRLIADLLLQFATHKPSNDPVAKGLTILAKSVPD